MLITLVAFVLAAAPPSAPGAAPTDAARVDAARVDGALTHVEPVEDAALTGIEDAALTGIEDAALTGIEDAALTDVEALAQLSSLSSASASSGAAILASAAVLSAAVSPPARPAPPKPPFSRRGDHASSYCTCEPSMPLQAMPGWGGAEGEILVVNAADPDVAGAIDVEARIFGERQNLEVPGAFDVDDGSLWFAASGSTVVREAPSSARWVAEPWDMRVAFDQRASPVDVTGVVVLVDSLARGPVWVVAAAADPARARSLARARIAELRAFDAPSTRISTSIIDVTSSP